MSEALFQDLLVIDCASFIAGPAAATMLSDFGARVIKLEPPQGGDGYRMFAQMPGVPSCETNYPWKLTNRNKESVALDLKQASDRDKLDQLLAKADVFITNFPFPVRERLKLNYEDVRKANPGIIYGSLTPYGEEGPEANETGYDATAWWARSGLMDYVRATKDTTPAISVPGMGDHMTACSLYGAIVTALYRRERTGEGAHVGSSLMANGLWSNGLMVQAALDGANMDARQDKDRLSAFTQLYRCKDERWFLLTLLPQAQDKMWPVLARCIGHPEWAEDPLFADMSACHDNKVELTGRLAQVFAQQDWPHWQQLFAKNGITCGRVAQSIDHCDDEQVNASQAVIDCSDDNGRTIDSPLFIAGLAKKKPAPAPELGEHTDAIFKEFGIDKR